MRLEVKKVQWPFDSVAENWSSHFRYNICSPLLYPFFIFPFYRFIYHLYKNLTIVLILQSTYLPYLVISFPIPIFPSSDTF